MRIIESTEKDEQHLKKVRTGAGSLNRSSSQTSATATAFDQLLAALQVSAVPSEKTSFSLHSSDKGEENKTSEEEPSEGEEKELLTRDPSLQPGMVANPSEPILKKSVQVEGDSKEGVKEKEQKELSQNIPLSSPQEKKEGTVSVEENSMIALSHEEQSEASLLSTNLTEQPSVSDESQQLSDSSQKKEQPSSSLPQNVLQAEEGESEALSPTGAEDVGIEGKKVPEKTEQEEEPSSLFTSTQAFDQKEISQENSPSQSAQSAEVAASIAASVGKQVKTSSGAQLKEGIKSVGETGSSSASQVGQRFSTPSSFASSNGEKAAQSQTSSTAKREAVRGQAGKVLERVEQVLKEAIRSKDGKTLSFRLDPPQLGALKVDVSIRDGILHARLSPENPEVGNLLRERMAELQSTLRKLGIDVEQVTVSVSSQEYTSNGSFEHLAKEDQHFQQYLARSEFIGSDVSHTEEREGKKNTFSPREDHWVA